MGTTEIPVTIHFCDSCGKEPPKGYGLSTCDGCGAEFCRRDGCGFGTHAVGNHRTYSWCPTCWTASKPQQREHEEMVEEFARRELELLERWRAAVKPGTILAGMRSAIHFKAD